MYFNFNLIYLNAVKSFILRNIIICKKDLEQPIILSIYSTKYLCELFANFLLCTKDEKTKKLFFVNVHTILANANLDYILYKENKNLPL